MKQSITYILIFLTSLCYAEGTKEIGDFSNFDGGLYLSNEIYYTPFGQYNATEEYQIKIRIKDLSEVIYYGMHFRLPNGRLAPRFPFRILDPSGNTVFTANIPRTGEVGFINNYANNTIGPAFNPGDPGYSPLTYTPTDTGDYVIEFNPDLITGDARMILRFFDVTVKNNLDEVKLGRLHSQSWQMSTGCFSCPINASFYPYHPNGVIFELETNGLIPFVFTINFNSTGTDTTGVFEFDRKSKIGRSAFPEFEVFLNPPDPDLYPTRESNIEYEATLVQSGCENSLFCIDFSNTTIGVLDGFIDFNLNNTYEPELGDVLFQEIIDSGGSTCIEWNGLDANGNPVDAGELKLVTQVGSGIMHLPLYDIEHNRNGYKISTFLPTVLPDPTIFWDDELITEGTTLGDPLVELNGCLSTPTNGCHRWQGRGQLTGDRQLQETINTWWFSQIEYDTIVFTYIPNNPVEVSFEADSLVKDNGLICLGDTVDIFVLNNGSNHYDSSRYYYEWYTADDLDNPILNDSQVLAYTPLDTTTIVLRSIFKLNPICTSDDSIVINVVNPLEATLEINDTICVENIAEAIIRFDTRQENPIINWAEFPGFNGNARFDLTAGDYSIQIIDTNLNARCSFDTTFNIKANSKIEIADIVDDSTFCYESTGEISVGMNNPTNRVYEYSWNGNAFGNDSSFINLSAGDYNLTVRDSLIGCTLDTVIPVAPLPFQIGATVQNEMCEDGNGSISLNIPSSLLTVNWTDVGTQDTLRENLSSGVYTARVFSNLVPNCAADTSLTVRDSLPVATPLTLSFDTEDTIRSIQTFCTPDSVTFYILEDGLDHFDTSKFNYSWSVSNEAGTRDNIRQLTLFPNTSLSVYTQAVFLNNANCVLYDTLTVQMGSPIDGDLDINDTICIENRATAQVNFNANGQNPTIYWSEFPGFNGNRIDSLSDGTYSVTVIDSSYSLTCRYDSTFVVDANKKTGIERIVVDSTACYESTGDVSVIMTNKSIVYEYSWNGQPFESNNSLNDLSAGNYSVTVRDSLYGCVLDTVIPVSPIPFTINATVTNEECMDGQGSIELSVPSDRLTINWSDITGQDTLRTQLSAGTFSLSVFSALVANCGVDTTLEIINETPDYSDLILSFDPVDTVRSISPICIPDTVMFYILQDGIDHFDSTKFTYNWYVSSQVGSIQNLSQLTLNPSTNTQVITEAIYLANPLCILTDTLNMEVAEPINAEVLVNDTICIENIATAEINFNTTQSPTIYWSEFPGFNGNVRNDLTQGTYTISVVDSNYSMSCAYDTTIEINANNKIEIESISSDSTFCYDSTGHISVTMVNKDLSYEFAWVGQNYQSSNELNNLTANDYQVMIRDSLNGCVLDTIIPVIPIPLVITSQASPLTCADSSGVISLEVPNDLLQITWSDTTLDTNYRQRLTPDFYSVSVTTPLSNHASCRFDSTFLIQNMDRPVVFENIEVNPTDCIVKDGNIEVEIKPFDRDAIYAISWDGGQTFGSNFENRGLPIGIYEIVVKEDGTLCLNDTVIEITAEDHTLNLVQTGAICDSASGSINMQVTDPNYTIQWEDQSGLGGYDRENLSPGDYTFNLVNAANAACNLTQTITIEQEDRNLTADFIIEGYTNATDVYAEDTLNLINTSSETTPITRWTLSDGTIYTTTDANHYFADAGSYQVTLYIEDVYGCNAQIARELNVEEFFDCKMELPDAYSPNYDGFNDDIGVLGYADEMELKIYNRWGEMIFRAVEQEERWDGFYLSQETPVGVYVYLLEYSCKDFRGKETKLSEVGEITLVR